MAAGKPTTNNGDVMRFLGWITALILLLVLIVLLPAALWAYNVGALLAAPTPLESQTLLSQSLLTLADLPGCSSDQQAALQSELEAGQALRPLCAPDADLQAGIQTAQAERLSTWVAALRGSPESLAALRASLAAADYPRINTWLFYLRLVERVPWLPLALPLALLLLIQVVTVRTRRAFFGWYGYGLLLGGFVAALTGIEPLLAQAASQALAQGSALSLQEVLFFSGLAAQVSGQVLLQGVAVTALGAVGVLLAVITAKNA